MTDSVYWIWFQLMFGIGSRRAELFLHYFEHAGEIYDSMAQNAPSAAMFTLREQNACAPCMEKAHVLQLRTLKKGCDIITPDHPLYPASLQTIYSKPAALYVKGDISCLSSALSIAMVGTRKFSEYGQACAHRLAYDLATKKTVVISGLAKGIDTICHSAALEAGGNTIGVLGCGIDVDYPKGSAPLKRAMSQQGAVLSEYPLGTEPRKEHFPMRNRIISGLAQGVVVVEADCVSGSMITAGHALEQGRDIFAVPGSIFSGQSQGTHGLIQDGAKLVASAEDILQEYSHYGVERQKVRHRADAFPTPHVEIPLAAPKSQPTANAAPPQRKPLPQGLQQGAKEVYEAIFSEPVNVDEICAACGLNVSHVLSALTELEIYGLIQGYPGRRFALIQ